MRNSQFYVSGKRPIEHDKVEAPSQMVEIVDDSFNILKLEQMDDILEKVFWMQFRE